jgi:pimeloyl-ACP methyl ester carboxylesterase
MDPTPRLVEINGLTTSYVKFESPAASTNIVILHGWSTTGGQGWWPIAESLSLNFRVIVPDLPGFASSHSPSSVWTASEYANWLAEFLDHLNLDPKNTVIAGHSFGGAAAALYAASQNSLHGLILLAPAIIRTTANWKQKLISWLAATFKSMANLIGFNKIIRSPTRNLAKPNLLQRIYVKLTGSQDYAESRGIMRQIMKAVIRQNLIGQVGTISCPTLIIWGEKDKYTPLWQAKQVQLAIPNSKLKIYSGVNHGLHLHAAKETINDIQKFVNIVNINNSSQN